MKKKTTKKEGLKIKSKEEKIKKVGTLLLTAAEMTILRNQKDVLMKECGKLAGQLAVAEKEKGQLEEKIKAQIASTSNILEVQAKSNKRINIAWVLMCITSFILGFYTCHFFAFYLGKVF